LKAGIIAEAITNNNYQNLKTERSNKMENCPYCNCEIEIGHDDGYGYNEDEKHQQQCRKCGKYFVYETTIIINHKLSKADCLNGADHNFKPTKTFPKEHTRMVCEICDESRLISKEELANIN